MESTPRMETEAEQMQFLLLPNNIIIIQIKNHASRDFLSYGLVVFYF